MPRTRRNTRESLVELAREDVERSLRNAPDVERRMREMAEEDARQEEATKEWKQAELWQEET
jgi:hypothetical protein